MGHLAASSALLQPNLHFATIQPSACAPPHRRRPLHLIRVSSGCLKHLFLNIRGRDARPGGRIGFRQVRHLARNPTPHATFSEADWQHSFRGNRLTCTFKRSHAPPPWTRNRHDLPGTHDRAQPVYASRHPDRRGSARSRHRHLSRRSQDAGSRGHAAGRPA